MDMQRRRGAVWAGIADTGAEIGAPTSFYDRGAPPRPPCSRRDSKLITYWLTVFSDAPRHSLLFDRHCRRRSRWPNLRRAHGLCHPVEDHDALAATAGRERFVRRAHAAIDVLPIVYRPYVAGRTDSDVGKHL